MGARCAGGSEARGGRISADLNAEFLRVFLGVRESGGTSGFCGGEE